MDEKELLNKYPNILKDIEAVYVPTHWLPIIDELCDTIENYSFVKGDVKFPQVKATEIKEKRGDLRFYYTLVYNDEMRTVFVYNDEMRTVRLEHEAYIDGMIAYASNQIRRLKKTMVDVAELVGGAGITE